MYKYTICFIRQGDYILMLNREKASWMGSWNGVGGKIERGEAPEKSILREIKEETGIVIRDVTYKGVVTWHVDGIDCGGMYTFIAELPENDVYETPLKTPEGILDWKRLEWLCDSENTGVAHNIPYFLPTLLTDEQCYEHRCLFTKHTLTDVVRMTLKKEDQLNQLQNNLIYE